MGAVARARATSTVAEISATARSHIAEGDRLAGRAEHHYRAAGRLLLELKSTTGSWQEWEQLLRDKIGIGRTRASELMAIADGRKTLAQVRAETAERVRRCDGSPLASGEDDRPALFGTGEDRWFTPPHFVEAARSVLGVIDLDPCSEPLANQTVRAARFFTRQVDGLAQPWSGRLFCNPPYSRGFLQKFADTLIGHRRAGDVEAAVALLPASADCSWFQTMIAAADAVCLVRGRVRFVRPDGRTSINSAITGSAVFYIGDRVEDFAEIFGEFGGVVAPMARTGDTGRRYE